MQEKQNIGSLFNRIAGKYDFLNHLLSLNIDKYWRRKAVKSIVNSQCVNSQCLDVAIGTADLAIEILRQMPQMQVQGLDLSVEMMKIGAEKVRKAGLEEKISFHEGSALNMPFEDCRFDIVTCAYGVRNFSDLEKGLQEMNRVMQPGGRLMILEFSYPKNPVIAWLYDLYFSHILPLVGRLVSKDQTAYSYLNRSVKNFVRDAEMADKIRDAGFAEVNYEPLTLGITTIYTAVK